MKLSNYERLIQLADEVFDVKNDPDQLDINPDVLARLSKLSPHAVCEKLYQGEPIAWVILIPTGNQLMQCFLSNELSEKQLFYQTPLHAKYDVVYLCSALILPEFKRQKIVSNLVIEAIKNMQQQHAIKALFYWPFSKEGDAAAQFIATQLNLPLLRKNNQ